MALLILSPEGLGALKAVLNNRVQRAMNLFFGSVLATISLTVPVVTLIAFMTGNELQFALGAPEMVVMVASLVLCHISFSTGRTNVLNGAAHLALFAAYLMTIFARHLYLLRWRKSEEIIKNYLLIVFLHTT